MLDPFRLMIRALLDNTDDQETPRHVPLPPDYAIDPGIVADAESDDSPQSREREREFAVVD
jgi:hypothetical protein